MATVAGLLLSPFAAAAGLFKQPKAAAPRPTPTQDQAAMRAERQDVLAKRKGAAANLLTGALGAESKTGGKSSLGL